MTHPAHYHRISEIGEVTVFQLDPKEIQEVSWRLTHFKSEFSVFEVYGLCKRNLIALCSKFTLLW